MLEHTVALAARLAGLVLLLVGVWGAVQVLGEAWDLYRDPDTVERFAEAVERGTHIDRILVPGNRQALGSGEGSYPATGDDFRPSHILGWVLAVVLLLLLGRLAYWILMAGSTLVVPSGWATRRAGAKR
jgi:hypothetical protein